MFFFFQAEDGIRDLVRSRGLGDVYKRQALGLLEAGFDVFLIADATSSRTPANRDAAIERLRHCGVHIVTTEMVLFEWLHQAGTEEFRAMLPLIK